MQRLEVENMAKNSNIYDEYIGKFNRKINHFKEHPKFEWLRKYSDDAISHYDTVGYYQIKADDFINRIIAADLQLIQDWLDGKNQLEWNLIKQ